jgi:hypothetical protein
MFRTFCGLAAFFVVVLVSNAAMAEPITFIPDEDTDFRLLNSTPNPLGRPTGDLIEVDAAVNNFAPGTIVTAVNSNAPTQVFTLNNNPETIDPGANIFWAQIPFSVTLATGNWLATATNGPNTITTSLGPALGLPVPLVTNIHVSPNGLTPTITWTLPSGGFDRVRFRLIDFTGDHFFGTGFLGVPELAPTADAFTIPDDVLPGPGDYIYRISLEHFSSPDEPDTFSRSSFWGVIDVPEPPSLILLATGLLISFAGQALHQWLNIPTSGAAPTIS